MAAYAEGFNILAHASVGASPRPADAEPRRSAIPRTTSTTSPCRTSPSSGGAAAWSDRGPSTSTALALAEHPDLKPFSGHVSDSGEGRWTIGAAIETATPAPVLAAALFHRFSSRGEDDFANRLLSAMRYQFGGHVERPVRA